MRRLSSTTWTGAAALVMLLFGCGGEGSDTRSDDSLVAGAPVADCGVPPGDVHVRSSGDVQAGPGFGVLHPGTPVGEVQRACTVARDTTVRDLEGMPQRQLHIALGPDTVVAEVVADSVWRLRLTSPRFVVQDSIRVGMPASVLTYLQGARALIGEGEIYLTIPEACGVSFRVTGADYAYVAGADTPERAAARVADSASVDLLLLVPCDRQRPNT